MAQDRTDVALEDMTPEDRALIELYLTRRLGDVEIAEVLRVEVGRVTERRERAFDRLAVAAGATSAGDRAELIEELRNRGTASQDEPEAVPEAAGRRIAWLLLVAAGVAAVVALVLALGGGGEGEEGNRSASETLSPRRLALRPPGGGPPRGSARLTQEGEEVRLSIAVRGLPNPGPDRYALWLYDSVTDARRLSSVPKGTFQADVPLPEGYERYRYIDVSREPDDSIPAHSGQSVLRAALGRERPPVR